VPVRPQLHGRPVPEVRHAREGRPGIEQVGTGDHLMRLGQVGRTRHVGDDAAGPDEAQRSGEQLTLEGGQQPL